MGFRFYQTYAVKNKDTPNEVREFIGLHENEAGARNKIRDAIASGHDYGYIKQGFDTIAYLNEKSFLRVVE